MTNKDALEALNWINWKIEEAHKLGIERVPVYETIRKALGVNQELVEALKYAVDWFEQAMKGNIMDAPNAGLVIRKSKQALAKAEGGKNE